MRAGGLLQSLPQSSPGSYGPSGGWFRVWCRRRLLVRGAPIRCGSLAFPVPRFPWASIDAEQLPPLALTKLPSPPLRRHPVCLLPSPLSTEADSVSGSSPGVPQRSPLHRCHRVRPLSVARGSELPHPNTFRPCRSSRLRRFTPHTALRVCCTPQPVIGFAWFRADRRHSPTPDPPPKRSFPLEALLRTSGFACHQAPCPLAVGARQAKLPTPRPRGFVPIRSSTHRVSPRCMHELPGVPSTQAFTEDPVAGGSYWLPRCPTQLRRDCPVRAPAHRVSTRRPPCSARVPSRLAPGGAKPWHS